MPDKPPLPCGRGSDYYSPLSDLIHRANVASSDRFRFFLTKSRLSIINNLERENVRVKREPIQVTAHLALIS